jgi:hypothetical protein
MVQQSQHDATACIYLKIFAKFFLFICYFLQPELPLSVSFGVAWSLSMSIGSYAQGLWLSGSLSVPALFLSACLQVPVLPSGSTCLVLVPRFPWLVGWWGGANAM